jgi:hypothetical protein
MPDSWRYTHAQVLPMTAEAARRAPFMSLKELIAKYQELAPAFGAAIPISAFGFSLEEAERLFSSFDQDYHISRFFHFTDDVTSLRYSIDGFPATHVSIDPEIQSIL